MSEFMMEFNDDSNMEMGFSEVQMEQTTIHNELSGRGEPDAHPISAINQLAETLQSHLDAIALKVNQTYVDGEIARVEAEIPSLGGYATEQYVDSGLAEKQNTLTAGANITISGDVISAEAGLHIEVYQTLPSTGQANIIYLIPNGGTTPNIYDEYVWIASTSSFEKIGTTEIDLSQYYTKTETDAIITEVEENIQNLQTDKVGFTDYPTSNIGGVIKTNSGYATTTNAGGQLMTAGWTETQYENGSPYAFIGKMTLENLINGGHIASQSYVQQYAEPKVGKYELIETITLSEDTDSVVRTTYPGGTPYNLKALCLRTNGYTGNAYNIVLGRVYCGNKLIGALSNNTDSTERMYMVNEFYPFNGVWFTQFGKNATSATNGFKLPSYPGGTYNTTMLDIDTYPNITKVEVRAYSTGVLRAGFVIEIWGIKG